jgi:hypothetical protein
VRVFIGGIMQGSERGQGINDQSYRQTIGRLLEARHPDVEIVDPLALFPDSLAYDDDRARQIFFNLAEAAAEADVVVTWLPEASMGTALEMVRAFDAGTPVVSISPMAHNWFIRFLSQRVFPNLEAFDEWLQDGGLLNIVGAADEQEEAG